MSTSDIIAALSDMADISMDEVNDYLAALGFAPGHNDTGAFGWLMKRSDRCL